MTSRYNYNKPLSTAKKEKAVKAFHKMLKDKNIQTIERIDDFCCITFTNGQQFRARGWVVDNSIICEKGL